MKIAETSLAMFTGGESVDIALPKKGGEFVALAGTTIIVQPGAYNPKKDTLTHSVVPPTQRHSSIPSLREHECLWSEVYSISGRSKILKNGIVALVPYKPLVHPEVEEVHLRVRYGSGDDDSGWIYAALVSTEKAGQRCLELPLDKAATFAVTVAPKVETFTVTDQGMLYNAKINHYISLRFPKKTIDANQMDFNIRIHPLNPDKVLQATRDFNEEMADFVAASDFYDIYGQQMFFKRPLTVKIAVPQESFEEEQADCIAVFRRDVNGSWCIVDSPIKFTKTTASFNTSHLGRFVIAKSRPKRKQRLQSLLPILDLRNMLTRCELLVSTKFDVKAWFVWVDIVPLEDIELVIAMRESKGASCVVKTNALSVASVAEEDSAGDDAGRGGRYFSKSRGRRTVKKEPPRLAFKDSAIAVWIEVVGDMQVATEFGDEKPKQYELFFCNAVKENYRTFEVKPKQSDCMVGAMGVINVYANSDPGKTDASCNELVRSVSVQISAHQAAEYYRIEVTPEPSPTPMEVEIVVRPRTPDEPKQDRLPMLKLKPVISAHLARLAESKRASVKANKEPKVLSGRSLQALSSNVVDGLSLAVQLSIPESTITGIGFDALSNGLSLREVTYKMLLRWKRTGRLTGAERVGQLANALKAIGRVDAAAIVWECHAKSQELTAESFHSSSAAHVVTDDMEV